MNIKFPGRLSLSLTVLRPAIRSRRRYKTTFFSLKISKNYAFCQCGAKPELSKNPNQRVLEVCTAAPPTDSYGNSGDYNTQQQIARKIVVSQYEALAKMAVIRAKETGSRVPLHLTMIGQGVFNNHPAILKESLEAVSKIVGYNDLDVFVHAYSKYDLYQIQGVPAEAGLISKEQFMALPQSGSSSGSKTH